MTQPTHPFDNQRDHQIQQERFLIHLMAVIEAARTSALDPKLRAAGLTTPAIRALAWIQAVPDTTMSDLAAGVFTDRTTLTRTVDMLVKSGFVVRNGAPSDRRKVMLRITDAGVELCRVGHEIIDEQNRLIADVIDVGTLKIINRALLKVHKAIVVDERIRDVHTGRA